MKPQTYKQRHAYRLAMGVHPFQGDALGPDGATCGKCVHALRLGGYAKCDLGPCTGGRASDIRVSWPACCRFEE